MTAITPTPMRNKSERAWTALLVALVAYHLLVLTLWLKLDLRPPRWDESTQLLLSLHSYEKLRQFQLFDALQITDVTLTKPGFVPFLSALTYFVVGTGERVATFLLNGASLVLLAAAMRSLGVRLFGDALVGVAGFALLMASGMVVLFVHFYTVDLALMALVAFTVAAALEVRAREFSLSGWTWALGAALVTGIGAKHLYAPFVAAPLLVVLADGLARRSVSWRERRRAILRQGLVIVPALLLGVAYHVVNWAIIAEQWKRATSPDFFADLGTAPSHLLMLPQIDADLLHGILPLSIAVLVGGAILLARARFAFALLAAWILGVWLILLKAAAYPLIYYYMPAFPALWLVLIGWLGQGVLAPWLRSIGALVLLLLAGAGTLAATRAQLGTANPLAVVARAPGVLIGGRPQKNPFVAFDSAAPARLDGNTDVLPYAHSWPIDAMLDAMADKVRGYDAARVFNIALLADTEYLSGDLLAFKLYQHGLQERLSRAFIPASDAFGEVDFLITKTGAIYKGITPALAPSQARAERALADDGQVLRANGLSPLYVAPLPDGSIGTVWYNIQRLKTRLDLISRFQNRPKAPANPYLTVSRFEIDGDTRTVLFTHPTPPGEPPTTVRFDGIAIPAGAELDFAVAMAPASWTVEGVDGATFSIDIESEAGREHLFESSIDPAHQPGGSPLE